MWYHYQTSHLFQFWISESPDAFKPELAQLLYPMFTHLYLELVCAGQRQMAQKFHKRHQVKKEKIVVETCLLSS